MVVEDGNVPGMETRELGAEEDRETGSGRSSATRAAMQRWRRTAPPRGSDSQCLGAGKYSHLSRERRKTLRRETLRRDRGGAVTVFCRIAAT